MIKQLLKFSFIVLLVLPLFSTGQNEGIPSKGLKANRLSVVLLGAPTTPFGLTYSQLLTDRVSFEVGAGVVAAGAKLNVFLTDPRKRHINIYTGVAAMIIYDGATAFTLPIGVSYQAKSNFIYSFEAGVMAGATISPNPSPSIGIKVAYQFGEDIATLREVESSERKNVLSISALGMSTLVGIVYERLLTPYLSAEAGIGFVSAGAGFKFYLRKVREDQWVFHTGASHYYLALLEASGWYTYFPVGMSRTWSNGLRIGFDVGPQISWLENLNEVDYYGLNLSVRIGKAF